MIYKSSSAPYDTAPAEGKHHWDGPHAKWCRRHLEPVVFFSYKKGQFVRCAAGRLAEVVQ